MHNTHACILQFFTSALVGADEGPRRERGRGRGESEAGAAAGAQAGSATGYHTRHDTQATGSDQLGVLAQSCVHAVHESGL